MQKIRHIKIIVPLLAVAFIAGFFVWHLMWMTELSEKNEKMILSDEAADIVKSEKIMKHQYKSKTEVTGKTRGKETKSHQENQYQSITEERPLRTIAKSESMTDKQETQIPRLSIEMPDNETNRDIIDFSNRDKTDSHKSNSILNPDKNKSFSATIKNKTLAITLKNRLPVEPVEKLDGADISTIQHPTSTTPY